jgi:hypothetical protein
MRRMLLKTLERCLDTLQLPVDLIQPLFQFVALSAKLLTFVYQSVKICATSALTSMVSTMCVVHSMPNRTVRRKVLDHSSNAEIASKMNVFERMQVAGPDVRKTLSECCRDILRAKNDWMSPLKLEKRFSLPVLISPTTLLILSLPSTRLLSEWCLMNL